MPDPSQLFLPQKSYAYHHLPFEMPFHGICIKVLD